MILTNLITNICNLGSVAGPVIQITGRIDLENDSRVGNQSEVISDLQVGSTLYPKTMFLHKEGYSIRIVIIVLSLNWELGI